VVSKRGHIGELDDLSIHDLAIALPT
jgi:hypothetical protein